MTSKRTMRPLLCALFMLVAVGGCNLIYKQNIQQGNALEQEDLDELFLGMNKRQVSFLLGTPSIQDPFHQDRWDYVQTFSRRGGDIEQRTVTLRFENDLLTDIVGAADPNAPPAPVAPPPGATTGQTEVNGPTEAATAGEQSDWQPEGPAAVEPDVTPMGERDSSERDFEEGNEVLDQRSPGDTTSPDISG